jgi:nicotinate-nucleotide adenylyltransferase
VARIGILGGSFNPPHVGHVVLAREAHAQLGLDRVLLMPVAIPPHKQARDDPGPEHRIRMCELAVEGEDWLAVSRLELDRPGPSYTIDTLREIHDGATGD